MKKFILFALTIFLTSCTPETQEVSSNYAIPKGLDDCSFYWMSNVNGNAIVVVRCPNSSTSATTMGKYKHTVSTIEVQNDTIQEQIDSLENQLNQLKRKKI